MDASHESIKLIFSHLPEATQKAFEVLSQQRWLREQGWYLAGGTALTLQVDHRGSVDLDFFIPQHAINTELIISSLAPYQWATSLREKDTLYGMLAGAKISFIAYPQFVPKQPFITHKYINVLAAQDIAVMKIMQSANEERRGIFLTCIGILKNRELLIDILRCVDTQYPKFSHNYHHFMKSLTYFEDAEDNPEPQICFDATWEQVKRYFLSIVPDVAEKLL